jgi:ubiquinone/menaquinone biosynthesis C-methylase UbiE
MLGNVERFSGYAQEYHTFRPKPPAVLKTILLDLCRTSRPKLVVDLGSGTGSSTRYWADVAERVVGIEPNDDMRSCAVSETVALNVQYSNGTSSQTGLPKHSADIVTCSQALHWMEPATTFVEVARILRSGGVFAAYDYDWPPTTGVWQADLAYMECMQGLAELEQEGSAANQVHKWPKQEHLNRMIESKCFRFTKEIVLHHTEDGNADRLVGLLLSQGGVRTLLKSGCNEEQLGIDRFREQCNQWLGSQPKTWYWSSRVRIGIV